MFRKATSMLSAFAAIVSLSKAVKLDVVEEALSATLNINDDEFYKLVIFGATGEFIWGKPIAIEFTQAKCQTCISFAPLWEDIAKKSKDVDIASFECGTSLTAQKVCSDMAIAQTPTIVLFTKEMADFKTAPKYTGAISEFTEASFTSWKDGILSPRAEKADQAPAAVAPAAVAPDAVAPAAVVSEKVATQPATVIAADPATVIAADLATVIAADPVSKVATTNPELTVVRANPILVIPEEEFYSNYIDKSGMVLFNKTICIEYMQPNCPTCKEFSPVWDEVAEQHVNSEVQIASFNCNTTIGRGICSRMGANVTPTIKLYQPGTKQKAAPSYGLPAGTLTAAHFNAWLDANNNVAEVHATVAVTGPVAIDSATEVAPAATETTPPPTKVAEASNSVDAPAATTVAVKETAVDPAASQREAALAQLGNDSPIIELKQKEFYNTVVNQETGIVDYHKPIVVEFMQLSCPTCQEFQPVWAKIAKTHFMTKEVDIANYDCHSSKGAKVCHDMKATGTPTIALFKPGQHYSDAVYYWLPAGELTAEHFESWLSQHL